MEKILTNVRIIDPSQKIDEIGNIIIDEKGKIKSIKTAVLWKKADSTFEPDFCAQRLKDNPWIVQPFEKYEEIRVEDLKKNHN